MMNPPHFWFEPPGLTKMILSPFSGLYYLGHKLIQFLQSPKSVSCPIICIGNADVGGSGKTPYALYLNQLLRKMGYAPHFLSRGYKGKFSGNMKIDPQHHMAHQVGDEPLILAQEAPTWVGSNRLISAQKAINDQADFLIMDDGLQHHSLKKNISFLVVDGKRGFGNGGLLPAGPLREPLSEAFAKVQAIVVVGKILNPFLKKHLKSTSLPVLSAHIVPDQKTIQKLKAKPIIAFAGIGNPDKFFDMLINQKLDVKKKIAFPDHHFYSLKDLKKLAAEKYQLVTTEKDYVRLPFKYQNSVVPIPITMKLSNEDVLIHVINKALHSISL